MFRSCVRLLAFGCLSLVFLAASSTQAADPVLDEHLKPFLPFVGKTWKGEFKNSTKENPQFDVSKWEIALKGKAIRTRHSVNNGIYGGETLIMWNPEKKSLVAFYFTTAGFYTESTFEFVDGKLLSKEKVTGNAQGVTEVQATSVISEGKLHVKSRYFVKDKWVDGHEITYSEAPDAKVEID